MRLIRILIVLTCIFLMASVYVYVDSQYLRSYKTIKSIKDPRWRIFDFNSRQASEGEIYNVSEIPTLKDVHLVGDRTLRFEFFLPQQPESWKIRTKGKEETIVENKHPEIHFDDSASAKKIIFEPVGVEFPKEISINIQFYPKEKYQEKDLSWPDNYWAEEIGIPVSLKQPHSVEEWVALPDNDPDIIEARTILGDSIDFQAATLERIKQVYRFVMKNTKLGRGTPSDEVQNASPLQTYKLFNAGKGKGFCENHALVYYLFANAAGIKTRLIDVAGKLGPLKLTGHYFCESWIPEFALWAYVDPQALLALVLDEEGIPYSTLQLKRRIDIDQLTGLTAISYDLDSCSLVEKTEGDAEMHLRDNGLYSMLKGDIVIAYKFGYGNNRSHSKIKSFLNHTTLLYSPFSLPKTYLVKYISLYGLLTCLGLLILVGVTTFLKNLSIPKAFSHEQNKQTENRQDKENVY